MLCELLMYWNDEHGSFADTVSMIELRTPDEVVRITGEYRPQWRFTSDDEPPLRSEHPPFLRGVKFYGMGRFRIHSVVKQADGPLCDMVTMEPGEVARLLDYLRSFDWQVLNGPPWMREKWPIVTEYVPFGTEGVLRLYCPPRDVVVENGLGI